MSLTHPFFSRCLFQFTSILLPFAAFAVPGSPQHTADGELWGGDPIQPIHAPFEMPQLTRPSIPDREFDIRDFGAQSGGVFDNTQSIRAAIEAVRLAGGGIVVIPPGKWGTGPIHFISDMELHLAEGSELIFSDDPEDYLPVVKVRSGGNELYNYSPLIYGYGCENVAITGPGKLNGNAERWWEWAHRETRDHFFAEANGVPVEARIYGTPEAAIRPSFVVFMDCRNVLMEGFTIGGGPNWTLHPIYCENIIIRRVHVLTDGPNNDGIDPDSTRNLLVEHCIFDTGDDCMVIKSGYNEDGWRVAKPSENIVMRWCSSQRGHGGLVIGSEMSGDVRNVYMHDCEFAGTDRAVRIKSKRGRGGMVENVWVENIKVKDMQYEVVRFNMQYGADKNKLTNDKPPVFRNFHIRNIEADGAPCAIWIAGLEDSPIENLFFENLNIRSDKGVLSDFGKNLSFKNIHMTTEEGAVFELSNTVGLTVEGAVTTEACTSPYLHIKDAATSGITIEKSDLQHSKPVLIVETLPMGGSLEYP